MTLVQMLHQRLSKAIQTSNEAEKSLFRVLLGEISRHIPPKQVDSNVSDSDVFSIIRKMQRENADTIMVMVKSGRPGKEKLEQENAILMDLLPQNQRSISNEQIKSELSSLYEVIKQQENVGKAIGLAMRYFKQNSLCVESDNVKKIVIEIRGE